MKQICIFFILSIFVFGFCSCTGNNNPITETAIPTTVFTLPVKNSELRTPSLIPTSTALKPILTSTPTSTSPTSFPYKQCVRVENQINGQNLIGNLILFPRTSNAPNFNGTYILDLKKKNKDVLPMNIEILSEPDISPDGNKIAYNAASFDGTMQYVYILTFDGKLIKRIEETNDLGSYWQWLNNEKIINVQKRKTVSINQGVNWYFYLYNIDKGIEQLFQVPIYTDYKGGYNIGDIILNDNLTYAVTSWQGKHPDSNESFGYEVLDLTQQKSIFLYGADLKMIENKNPLWFDGTNVIIPMKESGKFDLYLVNIDGEHTRLTRLSDYFDDIEITNWRLSPNKQKLGFYAYTNKNGKWDSSLYITDITTGITTDTCLKGDQIRNPDDKNLFSPSDFYGPVWSPDSQHLLIENRYEDNNSQLLWVDLSNNVAVPLAKNTQPIGWMADSSN